ncbi:ATP-binding protein [Mycolicibacterium sp. BK634]|uniref:AAA family ATPase n=1 Tax=Mycolicibacterium sp. BK634 TaxID=2587099 RepID=UPI001611BD3C
MTISYIEVCGFRSYGAQPQRIELTAPLTVVHADNSQGKTGLAEAFEFLHTGTISRRQIGGGSAGEFEGSLRNAHIDAGVEVYVEVGLSSDGPRSSSAEHSTLTTVERPTAGAL